ncbi:hypothetical protein COL77_30280 [Bacillus wiedmannii]|nr:hypothetical protein COL77_30280 [Bacillus wiedmannii]PGA83835.1 hypothetical protein COL94_19345 [Bacillus wiedmannii]
MNYWTSNHEFYKMVANLYDSLWVEKTELVESSVLLYIGYKHFVFFKKLPFPKGVFYVVEK